MKIENVQMHKNYRIIESFDKKMLSNSIVKIVEINTHDHPFVYCRVAEGG